MGHGALEVWEDGEEIFPPTLPTLPHPPHPPHLTVSPRPRVPPFPFLIKIKTGQERE